MKHKKSYTVLAGVLAAGLMLVHLMAEDADEKSIQGSIAVQKTSDEASYAGLAKVPLRQALDLGLKAQPGTPIKVELEVENGFLVYEVEMVAADKKVHEVIVDAGTGKILGSKVDAEDHEKEGAEKEKHD